MRAALDLSYRGVIPEWRGRYMAIGVAAQFELALRQKDIIGEWIEDEAEARGARSRHSFPPHHDTVPRRFEPALL